MISTVKKIYKTLEDGTVTNIFLEQYKVTFEDGKISFVPHSEANTDYQEILEWVANGGTIVDNGE